MSYILICSLVFAFTYLLNITYVTVFYHRGLTHGAVQLTPFMQNFVALTGNWVTGLDPKGWCCMHRMHHVYSDTEKDPHSPRYFGIFPLMLQQLRSYNKVLSRLNRGDEATTRVVADLKFPVNWLNRYKLWFIPYLVHMAVWLGLGYFFQAWLLGGAYFFGMMSHPLQGWAVNAFGHSHGYRNFNTGDDSRNNTLVAWLVMGEGYQNNHHRYPKSPKFAVRWFEVDMGYGLCLLLQAAGVLKIAPFVAKEVPLEMAASSY